MLNFSITLFNLLFLNYILRILLIVISFFIMLGFSDTIVKNSRVVNYPFEYSVMGDPGAKCIKVEGALKLKCNKPVNLELNNGEVK